MYILKEMKVVPLTKRLAEEFNEMQVYERDRPLSESRVAWLKALLAKKEFKFATFARATLNGQTYRVNGKHQAHVLSGAVNFPESLKATVETYSAETAQDLADLYASFDSRYSAKSCSDIYRFYAGTMPQLAKLPVSYMERAVRGLALHEWERGENAHHSEERAALLLEHPAFVVWYCRLAQMKDAEILRRGPVAAAMARTYAKCAKDADAFWRSVVTGDCSNREHPTRKLQLVLARASVCRGRGAATGKSSMDAFEMFAKCMHAWNAARQNRTTDLKYYRDAAIPKAV